MTIGPIPAACDAIAAYFDGIAGLRGVRGWPEWGRDLKLADGGALVSVVPGLGIATRCSPREVDRTLIGSDIETLYRVGWLVLDAQLDLWCSHRALRDRYAAQIELASTNLLPNSTDLNLTSSGFDGRDGYFDRPLKITMKQSRISDAAEGVAQGAWRQLWDLRISTDLVIPATHPQIASLEFDVIIEDQGISIAEPTKILT
jgi:hypothetical protein